MEEKPEACRWFEENIALNRMEGRVFLVRGDAFNLQDLIDSPFDRTIVPTPYSRDDALARVVPGAEMSAARPGGTIISRGDTNLFLCPDGERLL